MKKSIAAAIVGLFILSLTGPAQADYIGNRDSKYFFPENCSYVKMIKKDHRVFFRTSKEALAAGFKMSSKCKDVNPEVVMFVGNKSSKMYFPVNCSYVKMIKDENKIDFKSSREALTAGYTMSSKCSDK